ncbi:putative bacilysin exporter BacE [compost metagenome]
MKLVVLRESKYWMLMSSNADFRNLWLARSGSFFGDSLYNLVISWLVYSMTGSSLQVGLVLVTKFLPQMLLGLLIGAWVDRWNKKRLMQISDICQSLLTGCLLVFMLTGQLHILHVHIITVGLSILANFFATAQNSWIPDLVQDKSQLMTANSLMSVSLQITRIFGTVMGGVLIAAIGNEGAVLINSASFIVSLIFIQLIRFNMAVPEQASESRQSIYADIREGWQWLRSQKVLLILIALGTTSNIALGPSNVLPPMLIQKTFQGDTTALGLFNACIAIGLLLGGVFAGIYSPRRVGLSFALGLGCQGIGSLVIAMSPTFWSACLGNIILGYGVTVAVIPMSTLFQILIPSALRGRVNSISSMAFNISIPITYGGVGILGDYIGAGLCYALAGGVFILCFLAGIFNTELRQADLAAAQSKRPSPVSRPL